MKTVFRCVSKTLLYICKHCVITNTESLIHFSTLVKMWFLRAKQTCEQSAIHTYANIGSSEPVNRVNVCKYNTNENSIIPHTIVVNSVHAEHTQ